MPTGHRRRNGPEMSFSTGHVEIFTRMENPTERADVWRFGTQVSEMSTRHFNSSIKYILQYFLSEAQKRALGYRYEF